MTKKKNMHPVVIKAEHGVKATFVSKTGAELKKQKLDGDFFPKGTKTADYLVYDFPKSSLIVECKAGADMHGAAAQLGASYEKLSNSSLKCEKTAALWVARNQAPQNISAKIKKDFWRKYRLLLHSVGNNKTIFFESAVTDKLELAK